MKKIAILCIAFFALVSCSDNLFGSGGGSNACGDDIKCWRLKAENEFRAGNFEAANKSYSEIVKLDSTASVGYFGMAKAGLWMKGINPFDVFRFVEIDDEQIPFMDEEPIVQNRYLQGMKAAAIPLGILERRDSLTALYEMHLSGIIAPHRQESVDEFRKVFCNGAKTGACYDTTITKAVFPLSDREYKYNSYNGGLLVSSLSRRLLEIFDTNKDGCIAKRGAKNVHNPGDPKQDSTAWRKWGCERNRNGAFDFDLSINMIKDSSGSVSLDYNMILDELEDELNAFYEAQMSDRCSIENRHKPENQAFCAPPPEVADLNQNIDEFNSNMDEVIDILNTFGKNNAEDSENKNEWEEEINGYRNYVTFYKVATGIDEDGDGCIDEELLDGMDNDGDGLKNGNARLAPSDPDFPAAWGATNMMGYHSMTGNPNDDRPIRLPAPVFICNSADCSIKRELRPPDDDETGLATVMAFTQKPEYWISSNLEDKLMVAQDTACPPKISLGERKALIGGCWLFYDEEKFTRFWLKRELARDRNRVHPSCRE